MHCNTGQGPGDTTSGDVDGRRLDITHICVGIEKGSHEVAIYVGRGRPGIGWNGP